jgi:hypothetical protein
MYRPNLLGILYLIVGVAVAASHDYLDRVNNIEQVAELVLAVVLWPLVLLGVSMNL